MKNEEILKKVIEIATMNGWKDPYRVSHTYCLEDIMLYHKYYSVIFDHDFAKAFWGNKKPLYEFGDYGKKICLHCGVDIDIQPPLDSGCNHVYYPENCDVCMGKTVSWRHHLQEMVVCEEPLKYLERFLRTK